MTALLDYSNLVVYQWDCAVSHDWGNSINGFSRSMGERVNPLFSRKKISAKQGAEIYKVETFQSTTVALRPPDITPHFAGNPRSAPESRYSSHWHICSTHNSTSYEVEYSLYDIIIHIILTMWKRVMVFQVATDCIVIRVMMKLEFQRIDYTASSYYYWLTIGVGTEYHLFL